MKKVLFILGLFFTLSIGSSFADNAPIFSNVNSSNNDLEKIGNYTFDYTISFFRIFDKSGKELLITVDLEDDDIKYPLDYPNDFFVSDKYVYYVRFRTGKGSSVMQIDLATKKTKEIRKFPIYIDIVGVKGNNIYYNIDTGPVESHYSPDLKVFNVSTKKDTHIASNVSNVVLGKTRLFYMIRDGISTQPLYSITYDYKNLKLISSTVSSYKIIGSKIYYAQAKQVKLPDGEIESDVNYQALYVCNADGSGKKALTGLINGYILKISPYEIEYRPVNSAQFYKMNLKSKKVVEIP